MLRRIHTELPDGSVHGFRRVIRRVPHDRNTGVSTDRRSGAGGRPWPGSALVSALEVRRALLAERLDALAEVVASSAAARRRGPRARGRARAGRRRRGSARASPSRARAARACELVDEAVHGGVELLRRHDLGDEAERERLLGADPPAAHDDVLRAAEADRAARAAACRRCPGSSRALSSGQRELGRRRPRCGSRTRARARARRRTRSRGAARSPASGSARARRRSRRAARAAPARRSRKPAMSPPAVKASPGAGEDDDAHGARRAPSSSKSSRAGRGRAS